MLSVGYDFTQAMYHKPLETNWTESSNETVDWLLYGCEVAMHKINTEVYQVTQVKELGKLAHKTQWGIRMVGQLLTQLRTGKLHHGLLLAHAYVRQHKFYFDSGCNRTMPEQGHRGHGFYSQTKVIQDVLSMLHDIFRKMNAWESEEQVMQVPICCYFCDHFCYYCCYN